MSHDIFYQQQKEYLRYLILKKNVFNLTFILKLDEIGVGALRRVLETIVRRHESLRTTFAVKDGAYCQIVHEPENFRLDLEVEDITRLPDKVFFANDYFHKYSNWAFDFEAGPLFRAIAVKDGLSCYFMMTLHHVISDNASINILKREITLLCQSFPGGASSLPPLKAQYKEYAQWINDLLKDGKAKDFYTSTILASIARQHSRTGSAALSGSYKNDLRNELVKVLGPAGFEKYPQAFGSIVNLFPPPGRSYTSYIKPDLLLRIKRVSIEMKETIFTILISALVAHLYKLSSNPEYRIYIPFSSRTNGDFVNVVGWLTSEIIVCVNVEERLSFPDLVKRVADIVHKTSEYFFYPHERVLNDLDIPLGVLAPLFVNYLNVSEDVVSNFSPSHADSASGHFNLRCEIAECSNCICITASYNVAIYTPGQIEHIFNQFPEILNTLLSKSHIQLADI